jgi:hypothetical protein
MRLEVRDPIGLLVLDAPATNDRDGYAGDPSSLHVRLDEGVDSRYFRGALLCALGDSEEDCREGGADGQ